MWVLDIFARDKRYTTQNDIKTKLKHKVCTLSVIIFFLLLGLLFLLLLLFL